MHHEIRPSLADFFIAMENERKITCRINGEDYILDEGTTLVDFLDSKNIPTGAVVVEMNRKVLPRGQYDGVLLSDNDSLEIVQVIGGG
ncbi:MAG TPA: sulfur carrier protein ThiS [Firmicutes bacterium]|nr:sulfur carrier protein ThiS [Bacillota bacterium]